MTDDDETDTTTARASTAATGDPFESLSDLYSGATSYVGKEFLSI